ncbi:MAG: tetratricopeptide repeat protein [Ekhidna sp.]|nr:tetratricopeptide repeat protein [Ekhidna sp.]
MKTVFILFFICVGFYLGAQDDPYQRASNFFSEGELDSARIYIDIRLSQKPSSEDYFLSALIHIAEQQDLRALADLEAVVRKDPGNVEAYFQKGLIYFNSSSFERAIEDFTFVIDNHHRGDTKAVYYGNDPSGAKGTFITTLNSLLSKVYQYRAASYQNIDEWEEALNDFERALEIDESADCRINRSQLFVKMGREKEAIADLQRAIQLDSINYNAWYNLVLIDDKTLLPTSLMQNDTFTPMLNLVGANAFEKGEYELAIEYYSKAVLAQPEDEFALLGRGKALVRIQKYDAARRDFISLLQFVPERIEALYLIGNTLFYEEKFEEAIGFYEQYLTVDPTYDNVWFNAAMAYFSLKQKVKACSYLGRATQLGMEKAQSLQADYCFDN